MFVDFVVLTINITLVFGRDFNLFSNTAIRFARTATRQGKDLCIAHIGSAQQFKQAVFVVNWLADQAGGFVGGQQGSG